MTLYVTVFGNMDVTDMLAGQEQELVAMMDKQLMALQLWDPVLFNKY